jgi:hypothetical protein
MHRMLPKSHTLTPSSYTSNSESDSQFHLLQSCEDLQALLC